MSTISSAASPLERLWQYTFSSAAWCGDGSSDLSLCTLYVRLGSKEGSVTWSERGKSMCERAWAFLCCFPPLFLQQQTWRAWSLSLAWNLKQPTLWDCLRSTARAWERLACHPTSRHSQFVSKTETSLCFPGSPSFHLSRESLPCMDEPSSLADLACTLWFCGALWWYELRY